MTIEVEKKSDSSIKHFGDILVGELFESLLSNQVFIKLARGDQTCNALLVGTGDKTFRFDDTARVRKLKGKLTWEYTD